MSSADDPRSRYGLSCPSGGKFYICENTPSRFLGCCDIDPCKKNGICPTESLRNSSFSSGNYGDIPKEDCNVGGEKNWWTCSGNNPPFLGCCISNPCGPGCPPNNLLAAQLSSDPSRAAPFLTGSSPSTSASSSASATPAPEEKKSFPTGAIAGIAVGAVVVIALIAYLVWRLQRQKKVFYHPPAAQESSPAPPYSGPVVGATGGDDYHSQRSSAMYSPYKGKFSSSFLLLHPFTSTYLEVHSSNQAATAADTFHNNGGATPSTLVNSSARTTPRPPDSFYDGGSMRTYSAAPPLSPHDRNSHWSPSAHQSRHVSSHSSMGSEYHGGGVPSTQFQPISEPISELAGSDVTGPEGTISEIGSSSHGYNHQQQRQAGLGIK
ncbi:hypothetical protein PG999_003810 [Apiospora kogelbergensis]|uniref:Uncharacterized protein n=1 Tax=Apiospora kogelbergensis TaxID=1337665 RepID=A0AAW0R4N5_9PEZI